MPVLERGWRTGLGLLISLTVMSCGGGDAVLAPGTTPGGGTGPVTPANNVVSVVVDSGPPSTGLTKFVNSLYTSVTVCVPDTTTCQTIDHIQVDTGSFGLRILSQALTLTLPQRVAIDSNPLVECTVFADGYSWGPIRAADIRISGESANSVSIQVIGDPAYTSVPSDCSSTTGKAENTVAAFGANGILGVGVFQQDCGQACSNNLVTGGYYSCTAPDVPGSCTATQVRLANQVQNPVTLFTADNNGVIIQLPSVAAAGGLTVAGSLIFGIDTQSNNQSGSASVLTVDPHTGQLTTSVNSQTFGASFIDTGSNAIYFSDIGLTVCTDPNLAGFYCPTSTTVINATIQGTNTVSVPVMFSVANAQTQATANPTFSAFPELAGTIPAGFSNGTFDWGLPLFFGRRVITAVEGGITSAGTGPYVAF